MRNIYFIVIPMLLLASCKSNFDAEINLDEKGYQYLLLKLAPYVNKKPKNATMPERFDIKFTDFYKLRIEEQQSKIKYYIKKDSVNYFFYVNRDLTSLYEHYRGHGGLYVSNDSDSIVFLHILYYTPRWTKQDMEQKGMVLFKEMVKKGTVKKYVGKTAFIHNPNEDFYYNTKENKWDFTTNSSWSFLKESKEEAERGEEAANTIQNGSPF